MVDLIECDPRESRHLKHINVFTTKISSSSHEHTISMPPRALFFRDNDLHLMEKATSQTWEQCARWKTCPRGRALINDLGDGVWHVKGPNVIEFSTPILQIMAWNDVSWFPLNQPFSSYNKLAEFFILRLNNLCTCFSACQAMIWTPNYY